MTSVRSISESEQAMSTEQDLGDNEIKHLEFVQSVISRMAQHSFHVKGWSVTVVTAVCVLAAKESSPGLAALALFPAVAFWCLDAYYLRRERLYRKLYEAIADPLRVVRPFSMTTDEYSSEVESWAKTLASWTILPLYGAIVLVIVAEMLAFLITLWITNFKG
jgi:hypothetical protein